MVSRGVFRLSAVWCWRRCNSHLLSIIIVPVLPACAVSLSHRVSVSLQSGSGSFLENEAVIPIFFPIIIVPILQACTSVSLAEFSVSLQSGSCSFMEMLLLLLFLPVSLPGVHETTNSESSSSGLYSLSRSFPSLYYMVIVHSRRGCNHLPISFPGVHETTLKRRVSSFFRPVVLWPQCLSRSFPSF